MAASTSFGLRSSHPKVSNGLFVKKDGTPMIFHLPPGCTRMKLAPLIEHGGGVITSKRHEDGICLADEKLGQSAVRAKGYFWPSFVVDCVKANTILDLEQYRCSKGTRHMRRLSSSDEEEEDDNDDDMAPAKTIISVPVQEVKKGRSKYCRADDMNILRYLVGEQVYNQAKGKAIWRKMESLRITSHPAESMRTHYLRYMIKHLDDYHIPDTWKSLLTGVTAFAVNQATSDDDAEACADENDQADRDPPRLKPQVFKDAGSENSGFGGGNGDENDNDVDDFDRQLLQMAGAAGGGAHTTQAVNAEEVGDSPQKERSASSHTGRKGQKAVQGSADDDQAEPEAQGSSDRVWDNTMTSPKRSHRVSQSPNGSGSSKTSERHFTDALHAITSDSESPIRCEHKNRQAVIADSDWGDSPSSSSNHKKRKASEDTNGSQETNFFGSLGLESSREGSRNSQDTRASKSKSKQKVLISKYFTRGAYKGLPFKLKNKNGTAAGRSKPSEVYSDSSVSPAKRGQLKGRSPHKTSSPSRPRSRTRETRTVEELSTADEDFMTAEEDQRSPTGSNLSSSSAQHEAMQRFVMSEEEEDLDVTVNGLDHCEDPPETVHTIRVLGREFGLTKAEARECLWRNSGSVVATRYWILTGQALPGHWVWTKEQDQVLQTCEPGHQDWQNLENTRGLQAVLDRQKFLIGDSCE